jgi:hypothetical protein
VDEPREGVPPAVWVAVGLLGGLAGGVLAGLLRAPRPQDRSPVDETLDAAAAAHAADATAGAADPFAGGGA